MYTRIFLHIFSSFCINDINIKHDSNKKAYNNTAISLVMFIDCYTF